MGIISLSVDGEPINNVREGTQLVSGGPQNPGALEADVRMVET